LFVGCEFKTLRDAVFNDESTNKSEWLAISQHCQESGYTEAAVDILATVTVRSAVDSAREQTLILDDTELEEDNELESNAEVGKGIDGKTFCIDKEG
jgi:hypothetical protein